MKERLVAGQLMATQKHPDIPKSTSSLPAEKIGSVWVVVKQGDITTEEVDLIVNPADHSYDLSSNGIGRLCL